MPKKSKKTRDRGVSQKVRTTQSVKVIVNSGSTRSRRPTARQIPTRQPPPAQRPPGPTIQFIPQQSNNTTDTATMLMLRQLLQDRTQAPPIPNYQLPTRPDSFIAPPQPESPRPYATAAVSTFEPIITRSATQAQQQHDLGRLNIEDRPIQLDEMGNRLGNRMENEGKEEAVRTINYRQYLDILEPFFTSSSKKPYKDGLFTIKNRFPDDAFAQGLSVQKLIGLRKRSQKKK